MSKYVVVVIGHNEDGHRVVGVYEKLKEAREMAKAERRDINYIKKMTGREPNVIAVVPAKIIW